MQVQQDYEKRLKERQAKYRIDLIIVRGEDEGESVMTEATIYDNLETLSEATTLFRGILKEVDW